MKYLFLFSTTCLFFEFNSVKSSMSEQDIRVVFLRKSKNKLTKETKYGEKILDEIQDIYFKTIHKTMSSIITVIIPLIIPEMDPCTFIVVRKSIDHLLGRNLRTLGNRYWGPLSWLVVKILNYSNRPQSYGEDKDFENDEVGFKMLDDKETVKSYHFSKNFICSQIRALIELYSACRKYTRHVKAVKSAFDAPITALEDLNKKLIHNFNKLIRSRHNTNRYVVVGISKKKFDAFDVKYGRLRQIIDSMVNRLCVRRNKVREKELIKNVIIKLGNLILKEYGPPVPKRTESLGRSLLTANPNIKANNHRRRKERIHEEVVEG